MIEKLGKAQVGPRDLMDIHVDALKNKTAKAYGSNAYSEEGRYLVLELMGYLLNYYRNLLFQSISNQ